MEFLSLALSPKAYSSMLPSISDLVHKYQLDIEVALQVRFPAAYADVPVKPLPPLTLHWCIPYVGSGTHS